MFDSTLDNLEESGHQHDGFDVNSVTVVADGNADLMTRPHLVPAAAHVNGSLRLLDAAAVELYSWTTLRDEDVVT